MIAILTLLVAALAVFFEFAALYLVVNQVQGSQEVLGFLALHGVASLLFAIVVRQTLVPLHLRKPAWAVIGLAFSISLFIPFFGLLALLAAVLAVVIAPRALLSLPFRAVRRPEYSVPVREAAPRLRASGLRIVLLDPTLAPELRLRSLMALQNLPIRRAGPMLRRLLGDRSDDVRLTAYGLLEREAKRLADAIDQELRALPKLTDPVARQTTLRHVAELHWELVYSGLVTADLAEYSLGEAVRRLDEALALAPREPGLWFLRGRLRAAQGESESAERAYREAVKCGLPSERAAPYMAEIAFQRGDMAGVRSEMRRIDPATAGPTIAPLVLYWQRQTRAFGRAA